MSHIRVCGVSHSFLNRRQGNAHLHAAEIQELGLELPGVLKHVPFDTRHLREVLSARPSGRFSGAPTRGHLLVRSEKQYEVDVRGYWVPPVILPKTKNLTLCSVRSVIAYKEQTSLDGNISLFWSVFISADQMCDMETIK